MAQGDIQGQVKDGSGNPVGFIYVVVVEDPNSKKKTSKGGRTDKNGFYSIKNLQPGSYYLMAKSLKAESIEEVTVLSGRTATQNFVLEEKTTVIKTITVKAKKEGGKPKLFDLTTPKQEVITAKEIKENSVRNVNDLVGATGGLVQEDFGSSINVGGARDDANVYIIDGVKQTGLTNISPNSIQQIEVMTSGVPAKYGDVTGGVVSITTKGPSSKFKGNAEVLTSQFLDPFGYTNANVNLTGPIAWFKDINEETKKVEKGDVRLGYSFNLEFQHEKDRFPSYQGSWKIRDSAFRAIENSPYLLAEDGNTIILRQELLRTKDFERISARQNTSGNILRLNTKLDFKVNQKGTNLTLGVIAIGDRYRDFINRYALLNFENNPVVQNTSINGFLRLYHPLSNKDSQVNKQIRDANLTLQFDYSRNYNEVYSHTNGTNPFNYGYVGKFEEITDLNVQSPENRQRGFDTTSIYFAPDEFLRLPAPQIVLGRVSKDIRFTPGTVNPIMSNLTNEFINLLRANPSLGNHTTNMIALQARGAIVNGTRANDNLHGLFFPYGRTYGGFNNALEQQFRLTGNINFDFYPKNAKGFNKHTIEAGFEVEQRINAFYAHNPISIWQVAQNSANAHLVQDIKRNYNPLLVMQNGTVRMRLNEYLNQSDVVFQPLDSIYYDKEVSNGNQSEFSRNLRASLGLDSLTRINVNELNPNQMNVGMFSADALLTSDASPIFTGYDFKGNLVPFGTTFNDFFTERDARGNFTRKVAPFTPTYIAGYIQDKFQLKDINFNIGLRVDYFNSNQKVLRDPYVLNGVRTLSQVDGKLNPLGRHPTNVGDAAVYTNNITNPTAITGYRLGNQWYDVNGDPLPNAQTVLDNSGGQIKPYLVGDNDEERAKNNITSATFDPDRIFRNTNAQINIMPRINFTFTINENSMFFSHFDVLTQRPNEGTLLANPLAYYRVFGLRQGTFINNPDLLTPRTVDLEFGFKQKLNDRSALTINFTYKEYQNQLQITRLIGAYPFDYLTFANTDFSTVKAMVLSYDLRRGQTNFRMKANYTMQFAEGTGSSQTSQLNLINSGQGAIKTIYPLNFDVRHNFNLNLNYRFSDEDDYRGPAKLRKYLENSGIDINANLRSGTPFTLQSNVTPDANISSVLRGITLGDINSASKPWRYNVNLKIDKDFKLKFGTIKTDSTQKGAQDTRKVVPLNVYLQVTNLLNTENILEVYRFTGSPYTDGYLNSDLAANEFTTKELINRGYGQSFRDLYRIALEIPNDRNSYFARPRIIQLGASISF
jgi:hypothetical protein